MTLARKALRLAALALGVVGCASGTETGNPDDTTRLTLGARPGSAPMGLTLSEAHLSLPSVFLAPCGSEATPVLPPEAVDLVAPGPEEPRFDRPLADACGATVELGPSTLAEPLELHGFTALFRGTREDGVEFEIRSTYAQHFVLVTTPPATPFAADRLVLAFDLGVWLDAAAVPTLAPVNGAIAIDATHETATLAAFDNASRHAMALYFDQDDNGELEGAELTPVAVPE
jgi:hypothetical protein